MSTPSIEQPPHPRKKASVELVSVRRRDLRQHPGTGAPQDFEIKHGAKGDPRYPSPRELRSMLSFVIDWVAHIAVAFAFALVLGVLLDAAVPENLDIAFLVVATLVLFILVSFVDRVLVQSIHGATIGKALTGLRVIRDDTGGAGTLGLFLRDWLLSALTVVGGALRP